MGDHLQPLTAALVAVLLVLLWGFWSRAQPPADGPSWEARRAAMIEEIENDVRLTRHEIGKAALAPRVMAALGKVPRHEFVPRSLHDYAYENRPLPIGQGQTISQPYVVALMSDLLELEPGDAVLDVGTGSGYQAAVLAELARRVYSIEIVPELGRQAAGRLARLGYDNVEVEIGDGFYGWPDKAPFDGILIAAASAEIPAPLLEQLAPGGRLVLPLGDPATHQELLVIEKGERGEIERRTVIPVRFVPLTGEH